METTAETNVYETENLLLSRLYGRFPALEGAGAVTAKRRVFLPVPMEHLLDVLSFASETLGYSSLCTITGMDSGDCFEFIYHIASDESGVVLNLKTRAPKEDPVVPTVLPIYNGAIFYERELEGMLGVTVKGLPAGRQYPLPDNWPAGQYPLRKDWKPEMLTETATEEK